MSVFLANDAFSGWHMRSAFLRGEDDFALAWSVFCMGGEL